MSVHCLTIRYDVASRYAIAAITITRVRHVCATDVAITLRVITFMRGLPQQAARRYAQT
jgi:hypothetical protein